MQHRTWLGAAVFASLAMPLWADGHATLKCSDLDAQKPNDAYRAFECISAMDDDLEAAKARIADLETQLASMGALSDRMDALKADIAKMTRNFVPAMGDHPETKAIVAYYSSKGEKSCPKGWTLYEDAKDRFIFGSSPDGIPPGRTGGEDRVTLETRHIPSHSHHMFAKSGPSDTDYPTSNQSVAYFAGNTGGLTNENFEYQMRPSTGKAQSGATGETGGSQPHNNMPPFIALYFCQQAGN